MIYDQNLNILGYNDSTDWPEEMRVLGASFDAMWIEEPSFGLSWYAYQEGDPMAAPSRVGSGTFRFDGVAIIPNGDWEFTPLPTQ